MSEKNKDAKNDGKDSSAGGADTVKKSNFDFLCTAYGVDRAIARGLKCFMQLPADGIVTEDVFVKKLKEFTGKKPV